MKKALIVLSLSLVVVLQGCGGGCGSGLCCFTDQPFVSYTVIYPDGRTTSGGTGQNGTFAVSSRGYNCATLAVLTGTNFGFALTANPSSVYLPSPPASATISGQAFDATYGMPMVEYFDDNGFLIGSVYATSVTSDGTSLQANLPNLSNAYSGTYQIRVTNMRSDGYYLNMVGSATVSAWGRDRPDSDGDGWYDDEDCAPYDPSRNVDCSQPDCSGTHGVAMECNAY